MNRLFGERMATSLRYGFLSSRRPVERNLRRRFAVELFAMLVLATLAAALMNLLGGDEHGQEAGREADAPARGDVSLVKRFDDRRREQHEKDQHQPDRHFILADRAH